MKNKIIFLSLALAIALSGCSQAQPTQLNEKTASQEAESFNEEEVMNRINEIKNGKTPKVNPEKESKPIPPPVPGTPNLNQSNLKTNPETINMNTANIKTSKGSFKVKLDPENAPITVENFKKYANAGYYSGTIFHRVMPGFMVQGGGFDEQGNQKPTEAPIKIESNNGLKNNRGTIAMARTQVPDSATSQFFVNLVDNDFLNFTAETTQGYGYAVFGEVIDGMDVIDEIAKVKTGNNGPHANWPEDNVIIESVSLEE